jgi:hypothetical protein
MSEVTHTDLRRVECHASPLRRLPFSGNASIFKDLKAFCYCKVLRGAPFRMREVPLYLLPRIGPAILGPFGRRRLGPHGRFATPAPGLTRTVVRARSPGLEARFFARLQRRGGASCDHRGSAREFLRRCREGAVFAFRYRGDAGLVSQRCGGVAAARAGLDGFALLTRGKVRFVKMSDTTALCQKEMCMGTSPVRKCNPLGPCSRAMPRALRWS